MSTRSTKELLQVLLDNIHLLKFGLCYLAADLYESDKLSYSEYHRLSNYISSNRLKSIHRFLYPTSVYHYRKGAKRPRIKWLKKQIRKYE